MHAPVRQYGQEWKGKEKVQNDLDVVLSLKGLHSGGGARVSTGSASQPFGCQDEGGGNLVTCSLIQIVQE